jgi:sugar lactone lactonase YvrE
MPMPESIGCFALRGAGGFVVALRDGIWLARYDGTLVKKLADAPFDRSHHRFNDGRCDAQGRFWAGTMNERRDAPSGTLVRVDPAGRLECVLGDMTISNGLAWSPDGRTMYHADTPTRTINAYDFDAAAGTPSRGRVFARFAAETDRPDGAAVDREGGYWSAFYRGGKVVRLSPAGTVDAEYPLAAQCPTMCAFGGDDLQTLYVTTARQHRDADELARLPHSGGIFAMHVDVPGLPEPKFAG